MQYFEFILFVGEMSNRRDLTLNIQQPYSPQEPKTQATFIFFGLQNYSSTLFNHEQNNYS
jgi:hypothetical protein